jgi:hypothetical protein
LDNELLGVPSSTCRVFEVKFCELLHMPFGFAYECAELITDLVPHHPGTCFVRAVRGIHRIDDATQLAPCFPSTASFCYVDYHALRVACREVAIFMTTRFVRPYRYRLAESALLPAETFDLSRELLGRHALDAVRFDAERMEHRPSPLHEILGVACLLRRAARE